MKILLTGYSGLLGRHIARSLKADGHFIRTILHSSTVTRKEFEKEIDEYFWGSIESPKIIEKAIDGMDAVIHCAWSFSPPGIERPTGNEKTAVVLVDKCFESDISYFAFISSVAVYGMESRKDLSEDAPTASLKEASFIYPSEKIFIENYLQSKKDHHMKIGIFRPGPIYDENKRFITKIIKIGKYNFAIGIGNGKNHMSFIHAQDVADAVSKWFKTRKEFEIFNITSSQCLPTKEWYRKWGIKNNLNLVPVFIPPAIVYLASFGLGLIKKFFKKHSKSNVTYAIKCATRNITYQNNKTKNELNWQDEKTQKIFILN